MNPKSDYKNLLPNSIESYVAEWLKEDTPSFDYGGYVVGDKTCTAILWIKSSGMIAGVPFFNEIFRQLGCRVEWDYGDGALLELQEGEKIKVATVIGPCRLLLLGERPALNMLARASGIATRANSIIETSKKMDWKGIVAATRKTTPGFRLVEKYAALVGGADGHRMDLSSMIMIKDNHIEASGSINSAIQNAKKVGGFSLKIEVECGNEKDAEEAIEAGADIIMLDNFDGKGLHICASSLRRKYAGKSFLIEGILCLI